MHVYISLVNRLASLEAGEHDDAVFLRWQEEMKNVSMTVNQSLSHRE